MLKCGRSSYLIVQKLDYAPLYGRPARDMTLRHYENTQEYETEVWTLERIGFSTE